MADERLENVENCGSCDTTMPVPVWVMQLAMAQLDIS